MRRLHMLRAGWLLGVLVLLQGCGAGLITGVGLSQGGSSAEVRPPGLSVQQLLPLVPTANTTRTVTVTNAQLRAGARLRVEIAANGQRDVQLQPTAAAQGGATAITFTLVTTRILAAIANPTAADVSGQLEVFVDDQPIAAPVAVTLVRQVGVHVELPLGGSVLVLPPGGGPATLRARGLRGTGEGQLQMFVRTRDPDDVANDLVRVCFGLSATPIAGSDEVLVTALVPGTGTPDRATLFVRDAIAGESTAATVFFRPEVTLVLPSQGPTTGGSLVTLIGTALVPRDFTVQPAPLAFDRVDLAFAKGGRIVELPRSDFREELSSADRVVFRMPPSPDGRPGQVDIVLTAHLEGVDAEFVASGLFLYANPRPFFGPRGAVLDTAPVAVAPIALDAPGGDEAPDFAVLTEEGGTAFLQLLLAQENGMFLRFGAARQVGDHEAAAERDPRDLCAADFDGDTVPDLFVVNAGAAVAVHDLVLGQAPPLPPLGAVHRIAGDPGMSRCRVGDFDGDGLADVLLVPGPTAPVGAVPEVLLSRPVAVGQPAFAAPIALAVRAFAYDAVAVADLDGDGHLDVAVVDGVQLKLDVAYGNGDGTFGQGVPLDFAVPGYGSDPVSVAIGLDACGNAPLQSLGLVLSGDDDGQGSDPDPVVAVLHQSALRQFAAPLPADVQVLGNDPLGACLVANLDGVNNPEYELIVGVRGNPTNPQLPSNGVLRFTGQRFFPVTGGVEIGGEPPRRFRSLHFGRAFPATPQSGEAFAVFALHDSQIDGATERRLSTLLLFGSGSGLTLLPPDAGAVWNAPVAGIVGGNWSAVAVEAQGSVRDLALARAGGVDLLANDGFGGQPSPAGSLLRPGLLPRSVTLVPSRTGDADALVGLDDTSRLWSWKPQGTGGSQAPQATSGELRLLAADPALHTTPLADTSRVQLADVDGDGVPDLVALLRFQLANPGPDDGLLLVLRGLPAPAAGQLPFVEPTVAAAVPGLATAFALGDFAATAGGGGKRLELALAVPAATTAGGLDGDHVRFYRYAPGAGPQLDRFVASAVVPGPQALQAGSQPTRVAAADFDRDGLDDLLVAVAGDRSLREFRNTSLPTVQAGDVDIAAFVETQAARRALTPGQPVDLRLGDVDGDGAIDVLVAVESTSGAVRSTSLAFHLSTEPGIFGEASTVSPTRLGNRDAAMALDLGDWNRDGALDLFVGWATAGVQDRNVRVLFGGSR